MYNRISLAIFNHSQGMSDRRSFDRRSRSFFRDRDRDRRSPFGQKIAGRSRSRNSAIAIAKNAIFKAIANAVIF